MKKNNEDIILSCRLDKWLWVARFYKTRRLSSDAIKEGNISIEGKTLVKPSSTIIPNNIILIHNDYVRRKVIVKELPTKRESSNQAKTAYLILEVKSSEVKEYFERRHFNKKSSKQERKELILLKKSSNYIAKYRK